MATVTTTVPPLTNAMPMPWALDALPDDFVSPSHAHDEGAHGALPTPVVGGRLPWPEGYAGRTVSGGFTCRGCWAPPLRPQPDNPAARGTAARGDLSSPARGGRRRDARPRPGRPRATLEPRDEGLAQHVRRLRVRRGGRRSCSSWRGRPDATPSPRRWSAAAPSRMAPAAGRPGSAVLHRRAGREEVVR